jgi:serine/threonine protein kinase
MDTDLDIGTGHTDIHTGNNGTGDETSKIIESCGYSVQNKLGAGSYGLVYKVQDSRGMYAFKYINNDNYLSKGIENLTEIDILSRLTHPNILHIYKIITKDECNIKNIGLVTELANHDLTFYINNVRTLTIEEKIPILFKVANAVQYLHKFNILHLDIKPDNILLFDISNTRGMNLSDSGSNSMKMSIEPKMSEFEIKLADFGYALKTQNVHNGIYTKLDRMTLGYKPLESIFPVHNGLYYYNNKSDIYSLGLTFLTIISEENLLPYKGITTLQQYYKEYDYLNTKDGLKAFIRYCISNIFEDYKSIVFYLLYSMLDFDVNNRADINSVLNNPLFNGFKIETGDVADIVFDDPDDTIGTNANIEKGNKGIEMINIIASNIYGRSSIEMLFLAYELFFHFIKEDLNIIVMTCVWMADKYINGYVQYSLEQYFELLRKADIEIYINPNEILKCELFIIRVLDGNINVAKIFTISNSIEDLIYYYNNIIIKNPLLLKSDELFNIYYNTINKSLNNNSNKYITINDFF